MRFQGYGPLHNDPEKHLKTAITKAVAETANSAKRLIQADTPVDTGLLKSKWFVTYPKWKEFEIGNRTPYLKYVEKRFQMMKRNQPLIQKELERQLDSAIPQELNG